MATIKESVTLKYQTTKDGDVEETSFAARFLGAIDLTILWWMMNLAIGLGVLYRRRTGPIATGMFMVYVLIALTIAGVRAALSGN